MGKSGSAGERTGPVVASARSLPERMCGIEDGMLSNISCTCPPMRSATAGPLPLYGMWSMSTPVRYLNISPDMWIVDPLPLDAYESLPGSALASAMRSRTEFALTPGFTTSTLLKPARAISGARSLLGS